MSYQVVALRWRPQRFEDLVGQNHVSRTLSNAIRSGRVAHAFLFTGLRGVGKTTAARVLAKALNCEKGPTPTPCNECTNCKEITAGCAVDVLEIDGASNTGVDDVRQIIENVRYRPARCRYKVYIIDEVHMLSNSAFNALLKTLEEPPPHVKFIFATTDPHKLPATVQSRCQRYDFRRIPLRLVVARLREIIREAKVEMSDEALFVLAREGEGSMRDAQSLLEQVMAGGGAKISDEEVIATLGIADRKLIYEVGEAVIARDARRTLELVEQVHEQGYEMRRLARDLLEHFRNLAVVHATRGELLPELPEEEQKQVRQQAERISADDSDRAFRILQEADDEIARSPFPKFVLEMALIKLATLPAVMPVADLLTRLDELEGKARTPAAAGGSTGGFSRSATAPPPRRPPAPVLRESAPSAAPASGNGPGGGSWEEFVAFVGGEKATLASHLRNCPSASIGADLIEIRAPKGFFLDYLARPDHTAEIQQLAERFFARPLRVSVLPQEAAREAAAAAEPAPTPAELARKAMGDPSVQKTLEILGGELREVKPRSAKRREGT